MSKKQILLIGIAMAAFAVALGAFGAHALKPILTKHQRIDTFELAVRYQFYHAFGILILGCLWDWLKGKSAFWATAFFLLGIIFFCGSLYLYALTNLTTFALFAPIGGSCFLVGWAILFFGVLRSDGQTKQH